MELTRAELGGYDFDTVPPRKRQRKDINHFASFSDCQRIILAYKVLLSWISKGDYEWPGDRREVCRLMRESDWDKPALRPFIEEINKILNCGPNEYKEAKSYLKVRKSLQLKSPKEMHKVLVPTLHRRAMFLDTLRRRAIVSQKGQEEMTALRWCLQSCFGEGITPTMPEINEMLQGIGFSAPPVTKLLIQVLFAENSRRKGFAALWREAMAKVEYHEIRREELERVRVQAVRAKIWAEIEDELREKVRDQLGFQDTRDEQRLIPESVKFEVWRRDGGKCVKCGSQRGLEFDHIIPFSKGGSNTARNIQLLCESCNRSKSDNI